jgi:hypothetical protein
MNIGKFGMAAITIAAAITPAISNATPERASVASCAQAFASTLAANGASPSKFTVTFKNEADSSVLVSFYSREFSYNLEARDPKTHATLARATCTANRDGAVLQFTRLSDTDAAKLAAR